MGTLSAQDSDEEDSGSPWRLSYFPYLSGGANDGPMISARVRYWQPAEYEARNTYTAALDGASRFQTFRLVVLPLARPALAVTGLFSFMSAWNEFILAATLIGDPRSFTLPIVLQRYVDDYSTEWGRFAAAALLVSIPVVALFFALQRHFVEGLTAGSVKG